MSDYAHDGGTRRNKNDIDNSMNRGRQQSNLRHPAKQSTPTDGNPLNALNRTVRAASLAQLQHVANGSRAATALGQLSATLQKITPPAISAEAVVQRLRVGKIEIDDNDYHREIKPAIIKKLGRRNMKKLLKSDDDNCDFWIEADGTILIGENGTGGKDGANTELNFFHMFRGYAPKKMDVPPQNRKYDLPPTDSDDEE